ncbi:hypothetical protein Ahy_B02g058345 [Arachis hypogaea]|uniref:Reverse transcriptase zinc-binding domain-containing protein n=1 Tax=Arachis hypogaea TaxID=3818 RepID=A0A445AEE5_ARAHY|nr:hypothetical protein Ahy_B02g058345 [Arachis hypogaea]
MMDTKKRENNKGNNWLQNENSELFKGNKGLSSESGRTLLTITDEASAESLPDSATRIDFVRKFKKLKQMARTGDGGLKQNKSKQYDVSTGYKIAYNFYHVPTAQLPPLLQNQVIWKHIWGLKIQTKLQIFLWRAIQERLPMIHVIHRRFENTLPLCLRCRMEDEIITHCLFRCGPTVAVWNALFPAETVARNESPDFATWWMRVTTKNQSNTKTLARVVIVC